MNVWREVKTVTVGQGSFANGTAQVSSGVTGPPIEKVLGEHMAGPWQTPGPWKTERSLEHREMGSDSVGRLLVWPRAAERREGAGEVSRP